MVDPSKVVEARNIFSSRVQNSPGMSFKNVDRLTMLPEEIRSHILSLMPTKHAVRTSILSKRWRYSWMLVTNLDFDDNHPNTNYGLYMLTKFVDRVLKSCKTSQLKLFRLHFSTIWARKSSVSSWIDEAVGLNVRELDISVILLELPLSIFTCKTLTKLSIDCSSYDDSVREFPCTVNLPCLKTLDIAVFSNPHAGAFKLIHGCPMLESLSFEVTWRGDGVDYIFNIPTLKRLKLSSIKSVTLNKIILNVPNLEYLFVRRVGNSFFVMEDVSSLAEVSVSSDNKGLNDHVWNDFLKVTSGVKSFSFKEIPTSPCMPILSTMKHF